MNETRLYWLRPQDRVPLYGFGPLLALVLFRTGTDERQEAKIKDEWFSLNFFQLLDGFVGRGSLGSNSKWLESRRH